MSPTQVVAVTQKLGEYQKAVLSQTHILRAVCSVTARALAHQMLWQVQAVSLTHTTHKTHQFKILPPHKSGAVFFSEL